MSTIRGYKWTRPDGTSWHDPGFGGYAVGATLRVDGARTGEPCGVGLHFSPQPQQAISYGRFPGALWRVESDGPVLGQDETKYRVSSLRVIEAIEKPSWCLAAERVIVEIGDMSWLVPQGPPDPTWQHYETRDAARDAASAAARVAARVAARDAARAAAWDAASAAGLRASLAVVSDRTYPNKDTYTAHADARWDVWRRGYGVLCDVDGALYTYARLV